MTTQLTSSTGVTTSASSSKVQNNNDGEATVEQTHINEVVSSTASKIMLINFKNVY